MTHYLQRLAIAVAALVAGLRLGVVADGPAGQSPTFSVRVELVRVDVLVTSKERAVAGLRAPDFEIRDNGVLQEINGIQFDGLQPIPLAVQFVFDNSESMAGRRLELLAEAGRAVLARLRAVDQGALITFSERTLLRCPLSNDLDAVRRGLSEMTAVGRTSVFDALYGALNLAHPPDMRSMILLFSDGGDNSSWLDGDKLQYVVRQCDSVVYAVGLDSTIRGQLERLTEETGGSVVIADSPEHLQTLFVKLLTEMQSRYSLSYYPKGVKREGWHVLDVRLKSGRSDVKARRGYFIAAR